MKKNIIFLLLILLPAAVFCAEDEAITDIKEQNHYEQGEYKAGSEGNTLTVKKGDGFDFKVPEIMITGQVDTKVLLQREISLQEEFRSSKQILYETSRIYVPDYYLKDEDLMSGRLEKAAEKDFVGKLRLHAGSYGAFLGSVTLGKVFDDKNNAVVDFIHDSSDCDAVNDRHTARATNRLKLYYKTGYDVVEAFYSLKAALDTTGNPFASNIFSGSYNTGSAAGQVNLSARIKEIDFTALVKYDYFDQTATGPSVIHKENRFTNSLTAEKNFTVDSGRKVKTLGSISWYTADIFSGGIQAGRAFWLDVAMTGIFYFEPVVLQGGIRFQDYSMEKNYYRISPYLNFTYDISGALAAYIRFAPEMREQDSLALLAGPFMAFNKEARPAIESNNIRGGFNLNLFGFFADIYAGFTATKDGHFIDETEEGSGAFCVKNGDFDLGYAGIKVETLKVRNLSASVSYENQSVMNALVTPTGLPRNLYGATLVVDKFEWELSCALRATDAAYGKTGATRPGYIALDLQLERKITDYFTVYGYVNNVLNNNYYLLYYYKEKGTNLGIGAVLNF
jgi:hypothetical protein